MGLPSLPGTSLYFRYVKRHPFKNSSNPILKLLFTAGMTLIDSADSILMLYSYSGFPERTWAIIDRSMGVADVEKHEGPPEKHSAVLNESERAPSPANVNTGVTEVHLHNDGVDTQSMTQVARDLRVKLNVMSGLSIVLTLMSILVAFR